MVILADGVMNDDIDRVTNADSNGVMNDDPDGAMKLIIRAL
jgi:hypothetical protein